MNAVMSKRAPKGFPARLREHREEQGLTLDELAEKSGLHLQSIARLERGERSPSWETVLALAEALGLTPNDFLDEPPDE